MKPLWNTINGWSNQGFLVIADAVSFLIRCWLGYVFIDSGLQQMHAFSATQLLFEYEYHVPLIQPSFAAYLAVAIELLVTPFLVLGMGGRIPAIILLIFNCLAMWSYPLMFTSAGGELLEDHLYWGLLLLVIVGHGPGKWSFDSLFWYFWKLK